jgi:hypothetical protein
MMPDAAGFFLLHRGEGAVFFPFAEFAELGDALADGFNVGERAAHPALSDGMLARALGGVLDELLSLAFGADPEDIAALGDFLVEEFAGVIQADHGLAQVEDVDAVAVAEDVGFHLGVPAAGLVTEVYAGFKQVVDGDSHRGALWG